VNHISLLSSRWGTTAGSSFLTSGSVLTASVSSLGSLSFLPSRPPKRLARLPRETERDLLLAAFLRFSSSEEELEEEPVRAATGSPAVDVSPSASLGVASMLFLGAEDVAPASAVGLPAGC
jgi:hypothetical protein